MSMIKLNGCFCSLLRVCELGEGARKLRNLFLRGMEHTRSIIHSFSCLSFDRKRGIVFVFVEPQPKSCRWFSIVFFLFCSSACRRQHHVMYKRTNFLKEFKNEQENEDSNGRERDGCRCFDECFECFVQCFNVSRLSPRLEQQLSH